MFYREFPEILPVLQQGDKLIGCSYGIDGEVIKLPMGVFTMIAPFNFPAMVPFWFLPYAIATGNTFVVKASKQVPLTMVYITELIDKIGLPLVKKLVCRSGRHRWQALRSLNLITGQSFRINEPDLKEAISWIKSQRKRFWLF